MIDQILQDNPLLSNMVTIGHVRTILECIEEVIKNNVEGDIVELGCNQGTTSVFIQSYLQRSLSNKQFHVYDSFEGLPDKMVQDESKSHVQFNKGDCCMDEGRLILNFLSLELPTPHIHKGWFKDQTYPEKVAFAFFDGDLYSSIRDSWKMVYPKLSEGAIVCVHDYGWDPLPGVQRACEYYMFRKRRKYEIQNIDHVGVFKFIS
jgi:O-methyltransferase